MGNVLHRAYGETIVSIEKFEEEESFLEKTFSLAKMFLNKLFKNICRLFRGFKSTNKEQK